MPDIALRPRSATEMVDAAFQVYRREPLQFIAALGLIYVPWHAISALFSVDPMDPSSTRDLRALLLAPLAIVVYALASGVTIALANEVYFGRRADIGAAFRLTIRKLFRLVLAAFAVAVLIGVAAGVIGVLAMLLPNLVVRIAIGVLAVALIIYMAVRFFGIRQAIVIENASVGGAIERSWRLSEDQWPHVCGTLILAGLLVIVVMGGAMAIGTLIPSRIVQTTIGMLGSILILPLFSITETLLYYDTRIRNEGFDVEYLAASVPVPEQAGP